MSQPAGDEYCAIQKEPNSIFRNVGLGIASQWRGFVPNGWEEATLSSFSFVMADPFLLMSKEPRYLCAFWLCTSRNSWFQRWKEILLS